MPPKAVVPLVLQQLLICSLAAVVIIAIVIWWRYKLTTKVQHEHSAACGMLEGDAV